MLTRFVQRLGQTVPLLGKRGPRMGRFSFVLLLSMHTE